LSVSAAERLGHLLGRCGSHAPLVARQVAQNMRALGVYTPQVHRAYFAQLGEHLAGALWALRFVDGPKGTVARDDLARMATARVELDDSFQRLHRALATGRGAILTGPHIANYLLNLTRLNQELPLTVYLRYSQNPRRQAAKERWYRASRVAWISEPAGTRGALGRLGRMAEALRAGRVLFITPDLPRKRAAGAAVQFFGREIYLPAGPALLALRSGAPLFLLAAELHGSRQRLTLHGPFANESCSRPRARRTAVQCRLQWFASGLERFLREQTPLWYLWGDKRWTLVLRGDRRYVGPGPVGTGTSMLCGPENPTQRV
jgi:lauroyl/myristoyl acyltransferase